MKLPRHSRGFTLVEAVMVIVIIGVLSVMVAVFIRVPILGYRDTVARAELTDQADLVLRRIARDIRSALPNSVRVTASNGAGGAIEFLQAVSGGRYLAAEDNVPNLPVLDFEGTQADPNQFTVLAPPASYANVRAGDYVVVYNLGEGFEPANAWRLGQADSNIAQVRTAGAVGQQVIGAGTFGTATISLAASPFRSQSVPMPSPDRRFQVVRGPVSYYCAARADGTLDLWRAWGYPITPAQSAPPSGGQRALVAGNLASCAGLFDYSSAANQRAGLVIMALALRPRSGSGDNTAVRLVHQVRVDNTP